MLRTKGEYLTFSDGWGTSYAVQDRKIGAAKQDVIHFREATVGERRFWDAYISGTELEMAILVPYESAVDRGDLFVIAGDQYEVVQKDRKDTKPVSWLLSLKKAVVRYAGNHS